MKHTPKTCLALLALAASAGVHAGLLGSPVTLDYSYTNTVVTQTFTVANGPEVICTGGGGGNANVCSVLNNAGSTQIVDILDNGFTYALTGAVAPFTAVTPNAFIFRQLGAFGTIAGVQLATNIPGLDASRVTFTASSVSINMSGLTVGNQQGWSVVLQAVPEPQTWAMLLGGLLTVGIAARRARQ